jgi:type II secretory pathway predicted ATPase ExeA
VEARQRGDDVAVLLVQVLESRVLVEDVHALPLRKDHTDRAVLEYQPRFTSQEDAHLLVQPQLNKMLRQPLI